MTFPALPRELEHKLLRATCPPTDHFCPKKLSMALVRYYYYYYYKGWKM
jgi:hypothetical protein